MGFRSAGTGFVVDEGTMVVVGSLGDEGGDEVGQALDIVVAVATSDEGPEASTW